MSYLSLFFYVFIFSISCWLVQESSTPPLPSFCSQSKFWFRLKVWHLGTVSRAPSPPFLGLRCIKLTWYWLCASMNSHTSWVHWYSMLMGITSTKCEWGSEEQRWTLMLGISSLLSHMLPCPTRLHI